MNAKNNDIVKELVSTWENLLPTSGMPIDSSDAGTSIAGYLICL